MTDELKILRDALRESAPRPDQTARDAALGAAMAAFDAGREKNSARRQETARRERPRRKGPKGGLFPKGAFAMTSQAFNWKYLAMGGASLAALAIVAVNIPAGLLPCPGCSKTPEMKIAARDAAPATVTERIAPERLAPTAPPPAAVRKKAADRIARAMPASPALEAAPGAARPRFSTSAAPRRVLFGKMAAKRMAAPARPDAMPAPPRYVEQGRDRFRHFDDNPLKDAAREPVSTFSFDVDTASYAFVRRSLMDGVLPPRDAVRAEEIINYFDYDYPLPESRERPFGVSVTVLPSPWRAGAKLLHIGVKGYDVKTAKRPAANLVFLIDTSGSMNSPDKLHLLIRSFRLMLSKLRDDDTISIVTYAGRAGTALPPTPAKERAKILSVLENLTSGGSTAGGEGIRQAYALAEQAMKKGGVNRVILATDGDFNVGIRDPEQLKDFIARKRESGVSLTVLGFGRGNYNDRLMQALAQNGNGNAYYIDTLNEARKALVEELDGALFTIAADVKAQVEFNPARVSEYRLIGYETRRLSRADFNNDKVDAGDIGAGHAVTAIYEFTPRGEKGLLDPLRYGAGGASPADGKGSEYAFLKIRYKLPGEKKSRLITRPITTGDEVKSLSQASESVRFSIAAASFAQLLRGGRFTGAMTWDDVSAMGRAARGADPFGYRAEFLNLVRLAKTASAMERLKK